eukprot:jgi/Mesvir1/20833/Mv07927-RA.1
MDFDYDTIKSRVIAKSASRHRRWRDLPLNTAKKAVSAAASFYPSPLTLKRYKAMALQKFVDIMPSHQTLQNIREGFKLPTWVSTGCAELRTLLSTVADRARALPPRYRLPLLAAFLLLLLLVYKVSSSPSGDAFASAPASGGEEMEALHELDRVDVLMRELDSIHESDQPAPEETPIQPAVRPPGITAVRSLPPRIVPGAPKIGFALLREKNALQARQRDLERMLEREKQSAARLADARRKQMERMLEAKRREEQRGQMRQKAEIEREKRAIQKASEREKAEMEHTLEKQRRELERARKALERDRKKMEDRLRVAQEKAAAAAAKAVATGGDPAVAGGSSSKNRNNWALSLRPAVGSYLYLNTPGVSLWVLDFTVELWYRSSPNAARFENGKLVDPGASASKPTLSLSSIAGAGLAVAPGTTLADGDNPPLPPPTRVALVSNLRVDNDEEPATALYGRHLMLFLDNGSGKLGVEWRAQHAAKPADRHGLFYAERASVTDGRWHHLALVRDKAAHTLSLYVDGTLQGSSPISNGLDLEAQGQGVVVGGGYNGVYRAADIDEVRFWEVARTPEQIRAASSAGAVVAAGGAATGTGDAAFFGAGSGLNSSTTPGSSPGGCIPCEAPGLVTYYSFDGDAALAKEPAWVARQHPYLADCSPRANDAFLADSHLRAPEFTSGPPTRRTGGGECTRGSVRAAASRLLHPLQPVETKSVILAALLTGGAATGSPSLTDLDSFWAFPAYIGGLLSDVRRLRLPLVITHDYPPDSEVARVVVARYNEPCVRFLYTGPSGPPASFVGVAHMGLPVNKRFAIWAELLQGPHQVAQAQAQNLGVGAQAVALPPAEGSLTASMEAARDALASAELVLHVDLRDVRVNDNPFDLMRQLGVDSQVFGQRRALGNLDVPGSWKSGGTNNQAWVAAQDKRETLHLSGGILGGQREIIATLYTQIAEHIAQYKVGMWGQDQIELNNVVRASGLAVMADRPFVHPQGARVYSKTDCIEHGNWVLDSQHKGYRLETVP